MIPVLHVEASVRPVTRTVLQVTLTITPDFDWNMKVHGASQSFWIWVEDRRFWVPLRPGWAAARPGPVHARARVVCTAENEHLYHAELFTLRADKCRASNEEDRVHSLTFTIPIFEPLPPQYYIRATSDTWLGIDACVPISFQHLILPQMHPPHTELLNLQPLPLSALKDARLAALYRFTHFNPVQTQAFHTLYHSDDNVLMGAPTGSGKTLTAELALFRLFREHPGQKAVYVAPLKVMHRAWGVCWGVGNHGMTCAGVGAGTCGGLE
jgi:activating signal cointegrator complex subunit 3